MRLWHPQLIPYLPKKQLISQWRECIAIKRQWEKGTLKHPLVAYVKIYTREYFLQYVQQVVRELDKRNIKYQEKYYLEIDNFCWEDEMCFHPCDYPEHSPQYLKQCLYNLQEKADRNILTPEEYKIIHDNFKEYL